MRRLPLVLVMVALATALFVSSVQAQPPASAPGEGPRGPGRPGGPMMMLGLLRMEKVQTELALTDQQKEDIKKFGGELRGGGQAATPEERRTRMEKMQKELEKILKPDQFARLKEIQVQQGDWAAMPEVVKALVLTDEQKQKLEAIGKDMRDKMAALDRSERQEKGAQIRKDAKKQSLEVLTQEQRDKLEKLGGKKIELD
jgi:Spy/CpxP family protein refolding chaperone